MNRIKIKLFLKIFHVDQIDLDLPLLNQFLYCQVFVGLGVITWFNILYIITTLYFIKNNLKPKTFVEKKSTLLIQWNEENVGHIQLIYLEGKWEFIH